MRLRSLIVCFALTACGARIDSDREAELAALGLEGAIERALELGLAGFAAANSANIPEQVGSGDLSGTMTVNGQADQGASAIALDGVLVPDGDGTAREDGTTAVTGTVTNAGGGTYAVDLML